MDYEAFDRGAIQYIVTAIHNGVRLYVSEEIGYTDILDRAKRYRDGYYAVKAAKEEEKTLGCAFGWDMARIVMGNLFLG